MNAPVIGVWQVAASGQGYRFQVSTIFGEDPDFWTLAVLGSDKHHMISDFEVVALVEPLDGYSLRHAAE